MTAAYWNSFSVPFNFDDSGLISQNPSIRQLWPLGPVLAPPAEANTAGRPLANLSFALNYVTGGTSVRGYHAVNFLLHAAVTLTLFAFVRRTAGLVPGFGAAASNASASESTLFAFGIAGWWTLHPLHPASVTYVSQRTEVLMAFFYLQTLWGFLRGAEPASGSMASRRRWLVWSWFACLAGMACKESMVTAPVVVLLFDRAFVAGSFRRAWQERRGYYLALASTWILLGFLLSTGLSSRNVGFGLGVSSLTYALAESEAVPLYLRLALWPHPLSIDYGPQMPSGLGAVWFPAVILTMLLTTTLVVWIRWPRVGFVAAAFFLILAPTSSIVPVALQPMAENRVYLPLVAVAVLLALAARALLRHRAPLLLALLAAPLAVATFQRNAQLHDLPATWRQAIACRPQNVRAWENYAAALCLENRFAEAVPAVQRSIALKPDGEGGHRMLGDILFNLGRRDEAIVAYRRALELGPRHAATRYHLGVLLMSAGRLPEAIVEFERVLTTDAANLAVHRHLAQIALQQGQPEPAVLHLDRIGGTPVDDAGLRFGVANLFVVRNQPAAAVPHYEHAILLDPKAAPAHAGLSAALILLGRPDQAAAQARRALELKPDYVEARHTLAVALYRSGRIDEAARELEETLRLKPDYAEARRSLDELRAQATKSPHRVP